MDAELGHIHGLIERGMRGTRAHVAMPLAAALAAGLLLALAESPATAQAQARESALAGAIVDPASVAAAAANAPMPAPAPAEPVPAVMAPGDYEWYPDRSPAGDVLIVVSLPQQVLHVYRGGVRIGRSTVSSGRAGHDTPPGVFTILQKKKMHRSTLYDDAPMPFMQRLTWDGIALHAGRLPGYPASHGCVRLPAAFAEKLYGATSHGVVVVVADDAGFAPDVVRPGDTVNADLLAAAAGVAAPEAEVAAAQGTGLAAAM